MDNNKNEEFEKLFFSKAHSSAFLKLRTSVEKKRAIGAASDYQIFITQLAGMLSEILKDNRFKTKTFLGAIDYLCKKLLKNNELYGIMKILEINEKGNAIKHDGKIEPINLDETTRQYNNMIDSLIKCTGITSLSKCKIGIKKATNKVKIFDEKKSVKYENIAGHKFTFRLSPFYTYDKYKKEASIDLRVDWEENSNDTFVIDVYTKDKKISTTQKTSMKVNKYKKFVLNLNKNDMYGDNFDIVVCDLTIRIYRPQKKIVTEKKSYEKRFLLWKKTHYYTTEKEEISEQLIEKKLTISQKIREERNN